MSFIAFENKNPIDFAKKILEKELSGAPGKVLFLTSGGSSLNILDSIQIKDPRYVTLGLIDERYTIDPKDQNISQLLDKTHVRRIQRKGMKVISILDKNLSMEECALLYEKKIRQWKKDNPKGLVIALLGIGRDGHTAGILPYPEHPKLFNTLFESDRWVVAYDAGSKDLHSLRITVTNTFLRYVVDTAVMYMSGEIKKDALAHILVPFGTLVYTPARIVYDMKSVILSTDLPL